MPQPLDFGLIQPQTQLLGANPNALLQLQLNQLRLQEYQKEIGAQNALGQMFGNRENINSQGQFQPTGNALAQYGQQYPQQALELQNSLSAMAGQQQRNALVAGKVQQDEQHRVVMASLDARSEYEKVKQATGSEEQANQAAQKVYTQKMDELKSTLTPETRNRIAPNWDYNRNTQTLMMDPQYRAMLHEQTAEKRADITESRGRYEPPEKVRTPDGREILMQFDKDNRVFRSLGAGTTEVFDPKDVTKVGTEKQRTPAQQAFDKFLQDNPNASATDMSKFIESQRPARSGAAAAVRKFMEENPNASSTEIASFNAWQRETSAGAQAFGTGPQGNLTRSQNVAIDHLGTLGNELIPALGNGDVRALNFLKNWAKNELGYEGPVDFNFAKQIVSQEVLKSIVNVGAGTEDERRNLSKNLSDANSPEQLYGVISTAKKLMAGQLRGLEGQYVDVTVPPGQKSDPEAVRRARDSFRNKLSPTTVQELSSLGGGKAEAPVPPTQATQQPATGGTAPEVTQQQYDKLPGNGTPYRIPGNPTVFYKP